MFRDFVVPILRQITADFREGRDAKLFASPTWANRSLRRRLVTLVLAVPGIELGYCARPGEADVRVIGSAEADRASGGDCSRKTGQRDLQR